MSAVFVAMSVAFAVLMSPNYVFLAYKSLKSVPLTTILLLLMCLYYSMSKALVNISKIDKYFINILSSRFVGSDMLDVVWNIDDGIWRHYSFQHHIHK